jgi:hypothetical protein
MTSATPDQNFSDPLEIVLDLLLNLAGTAIAGGLTVVAKRLWRRHSSRAVEGQGYFDPDSISRAHLRSIRASLDELAHLVGRASTLVDPTQKRELGSRLFLTRQQLEEYHRIRGALFDGVKKVDEVLESLPELEEGDARLPHDIEAQRKFIEKQLSQSRTAGRVEDSFLAIWAAVAGMHRMLDRVEALEPEAPQR